MILKRVGDWRAAIVAPAWLLALMFAAPAAGDWLVLRDGTRLETDGAWEVKGRQVVFTRPGGALAAVRLADVDLEASDEATQAAKAGPVAAADSPPAQSQSQRRRPVLVLTDETLASSSDPDAQEEDEVFLEDEGAEGAASADGENAEGDGSEEDGSEDEASEEDGSESSDSASEPVYVVSWSEKESSAVDGLEIIGKVRNRGKDVAAAIQVQVKAADEDGAPFVDTRAFLQKSSLAPGHTATFRALLPGIYALLEDPTFEISSEGFTMQLVAESEDEDGDEYEGEEFGGEDLGADEFDEDLGDYDLDEFGDADAEFGDDDAELGYDDEVEAGSGRV